MLMIMEPAQPAKPVAPNGGVMDVRPPKLVHDEASGIHEPVASPDSTGEREPKDKTPDHPAVVQRGRDVRRAQAARPKPAGGRGTGLAITATILIVLGLGALFTYAYLRTNGIAIR